MDGRKDELADAAQGWRKVEMLDSGDLACAAVRQAAGICRAVPIQLGGGGRKSKEPESEILIFIFYFFSVHGYRSGGHGRRVGGGGGADDDTSGEQCRGAD